MTTNSPTSVNLKNPILAAGLAWLFPGLGHLYQGRTGKALLYAVAIVGLFFLGAVLGENELVFWRWVSPLREEAHFRWAYVMQFWIGLPALSALVQGTLTHYDLAPILWGFQAEPTTEQFNEVQERLGKLVEIGTFYTEVAGLLNLLAIFDAAFGPAFPEGLTSEPDVANASSSDQSQANPSETEGKS